MGQKSKLKKIKKMALKKKKEEEPEEEFYESSTSASEIERRILKSTFKPPFQIILDTNFINDCIRKKKDLEESLMDCLDGEVQLYVPECVFGELEKLGRVYRLALNLIRGLKHEVLKCDHKGVYADDCIINRIKQSKNFIIATTDANLRQRIKKVPIIPVVYFRGNKVVSERFAGGSLY